VTFVLYLLFFLSGAAALVYQVLWVRSLALVFGGSHLAVTTVLAVFMGGLALGGWWFGRVADRSTRPLRLYGVLELGIAASALAFLGLLEAFPHLYAPLARLREGDRLWLTLLRVAFGALALIAPTTLMGGTLPVLVRFVSRGPSRRAAPLAFLYGFNTLGAVVGTFLAAFVLLPSIGVLRAYGVALAVNVAIGLASLALTAPAAQDGATTRVDEDRPHRGAGDAPEPAEPFTGRLVLWGIGISGFCALGYEVLWTRTLAMIVGTSVYGFAIMLIAFLAGIAAGSHAHVLLPRFARASTGGIRAATASFGLAQIAIGVAAFATTVALRDLPAHATALQGWFRSASGEFGARQIASFVLAFAFMAVPAFFMGFSFPVAGEIHARRRDTVGASTGQVLAVNTVGAILGSAGSGFVLLYLLGLERSILTLCAVNVGTGVAVLAANVPRSRTVAKSAVATIAGATAIGIAALAVAPDDFRIWDRDYFAVYRNNQRSAFATPEKIADAVANTDVLYYHQGANEIISVIRPKGGATSILVDGKVVASSNLEDIQCQRTLGHLPMLAHPDPRSVFVLGLGTGMTLGSTSLHPGVEEIVLAELEPAVIPAAREFAGFNHSVLDDPRLRVIHEDGRNYLRTTRKTFDVITADPVHPWTGGAAYLYTDEYFRTARARLSPGGVMCQWLPIYELTVDDLRSVVRTFADNFNHVALWLTHYDAELIASDEPLDFDERRLAARMARGRIADDLAEVDMGSPREFLSYFVAGNRGVRAFASGGTLNTDDNLSLEFSAPRSQGRLELMGYNVLALGEHRESPVPLGVPETDPEKEAERQEFWRRMVAAGPDYDRAHALFLWNRWDEPAFAELLAHLRGTFPDHAPSRFLERKVAGERAGIPRPIASLTLAARDPRGVISEVELFAVTARVGRDRGTVMFADPATRTLFGERYVDAPEDDLDGILGAVAERVLDAVRDDHRAWIESLPPAARPPRREQVEARIRKVVAEILAEDAD